MSKTDGRELEVAAAKSRSMQHWVLGTVCALVIGLYGYTAQSGCLESFCLNPADTYYNLLVQGFRAGQLSLKKDVPVGLARLANPYDSTANALYRSESSGMLDLSYYKGRFYLYFGVTPALILFWPFVALTGQYLFHKQAVAIFCAISFLISVGLLRALWRRYFAEVHVGVVAACALALGLATGMPVLLAQCDVYEVAIGCGCLLTMLALAAIWCAVHDPERRYRWLAAASLAYGMALGARPSLLFGAVILLVPVVQAWRERRKIALLLTAAIGPIVLIGLGLMFYNALRFNNPMEFGQRLQINAAQQVARQFFSPRYLWFNFRVYFLELARWSGRFPFVHGIVVPPLPPGHEVVQAPFGILTNIPLVWLAMVLPLVWRGRLVQIPSALRWFLLAVTLFFGVYALTLCLYFGACFRFEVEFLPALVLLAAVGILGLERATMDRPRWQPAVRWGWSLVLGFSVAFNLLATVLYHADSRYWQGVVLAQQGRLSEAIQIYEDVLRIRPDFAEAHNNLGVALARRGKIQAAIGEYNQALQINPDYAEAHNNLAVALGREGRTQEAIRHCEQALRINPDYAEAHDNLGNALAQGGNVEEAVGQYEQALQIRPDYAEAHFNLGVALARLGRMSEAMDHWEQALRIRPQYANAHYSLGVALERLGRVGEAISHYQSALQINPNLVEARNGLARLRAIP